MHADNGDEELTFTRSSGNVFADLGLDNADDRLIKADLAIAITGIIRRNQWTQEVAAERTGLTQPQISRLLRAKFDGFSQERMQKVLRNLGVDVEISLHRREPGGIGTLRVRELV